MRLAPSECEPPRSPQHHPSQCHRRCCGSRWCFLMPPRRARLHHQTSPATRSTFSRSPSTRSSATRQASAHSSSGKTPPATSTLRSSAAAQSATRYPARGRAPPLPGATRPRLNPARRTSSASAHSRPASQRGRRMRVTATAPSELPRSQPRSRRSCGGCGTGMDDACVLCSVAIAKAPEAGCHTRLRGHPRRMTEQRRP